MTGIIKERYGDRLAELRVQAGYTQKSLAILLGVAQRTISSWETGEREPSLSMFKRFLLACGASADDVLDMPAPLPPDGPEAEAATSTVRLRVVHAYAA